MHGEVIWENERGLFLRVMVKPNSRSREFLASFSTEEIIFNLQSPARDGKANTELVKKLSKLLGVSTSAISIVAGQKGREKTICVTGVSRQELAESLSKLTNAK
jgi:uncharacterized protein (TIGR00251 family)